MRDKECLNELHRAGMGLTIQHYKMTHTQNTHHDGEKLEGIFKKTSEPYLLDIAGYITIRNDLMTPGYANAHGSQGLTLFGILGRLCGLHCEF